MNDTESTPTVYLVDDDASIRSALTRALNAEGFHVMSWASADAFLADYDPEKPGCLVADVAMPGTDGLQLQQLLSVSDRNLPIVFITGHGDVPMTVQAMKGGAVEFLTKPFDDEVLLNAIRHAIRRSVAVLNDQSEITALRSSYESLTPRERDVMKFVVAGMLNKQIGLKLDISEITVKAHRGKMMQKMKAESLADLVKTAVRLGLTPARNPWHTTEL